MSIVFPQSVSRFCVDAITWDWEPGTRDLGPGNLPGTRDLELGTWDLGPGTWDLALGTGSGSKRGRQQAQHVQHAAAGAACGSRQHAAAGAACSRRSMCQAEKAAGAAGSRWGGGLQFDRFLLEGAWGVTYCGFPTAAVRALPWYVLVTVPYICLRRVCLPCEQGKLRWARERGRTVHSVLGPALVGPTLKRLPFSYATHKGITAQRHCKDYSSSNATRRAAHSLPRTWPGRGSGNGRKCSETRCCDE